MNSLLDRIAGWLDRFYSRHQYRDLEEYLSHSQNLSDLESRIRRWDQIQTRNSNFHFS
jgi:hypothetical protein